jgi:hypothetical protein
MGSLREGDHPGTAGVKVTAYPPAALPANFRQTLVVCVRNCDVYDCAGNRSLTFAARFDLLGFAEPRT